MYLYKHSMYFSAPVCTVCTKILQWMLFCVVCLWETILCVGDMYAVVLEF